MATRKEIPTNIPGLFLHKTVFDNQTLPGLCVLENEHPQS